MLFPQLQLGITRLPMLRLENGHVAKGVVHRGPEAHGHQPGGGVRRHEGQSPAVRRVGQPQRVEPQALGSAAKCGEFGWSGENAERLLSVMAPGNMGLVGAVVDAEDAADCCAFWSTLSAVHVCSAPALLEPCAPLWLRICSMACTTSLPQPCSTSSRTLRLWLGNTRVRMSMAFMCREAAEDGDGSCSSLSVSEPESEPRELTERGGETLRGAVEELQLSRLVLLLRLLPPQRHLRRHHALPLGDQCALGAHTVLPAAVALVALQRGHHAVVPAAGALRGARVLVRGAQDELRAAHKSPGHGHRDGAG
ncbi:hypothetical protein EYF80_015348 [Liparis tanakae]|uniref:Uncharacterized protein n=1 Tax=Liparis tanakae TaxID=230148 RepID=A0A4Z2I8K0_9TELE|nr:hypothetical protein EYF80_015348 [Liparis tanakae]